MNDGTCECQSIYVVGQFMVTSEDVIKRLAAAGVPIAKLDRAAKRVFQKTCAKGKCVRCRWGDGGGTKDYYRNAATDANLGVQIAYMASRFKEKR